jgi:hypothetical protein
MTMDTEYGIGIDTEGLPKAGYMLLDIRCVTTAHALLESQEGYVAAYCEAAVP